MPDHVNRLFHLTLIFCYVFFINWRENIYKFEHTSDTWLQWLGELYPSSLNNWRVPRMGLQWLHLTAMTAGEPSLQLEPHPATQHLDKEQTTVNHLWKKNRWHCIVLCLSTFLDYSGKVDKHQQHIVGWLSIILVHNTSLAIIIVIYNYYFLILI